MAYPIKIFPQRWQQAFPWQRYQRLHHAVKHYRLNSNSRFMPLTTKTDAQGTWYQRQSGGEVGYLKSYYGNGLGGAFSLGQWFGVLLPLRFNPYYRARQPLPFCADDHPVSKIKEYDARVKTALSEKLRKIAQEPWQNPWQWVKRQYRRLLTAEGYYTLYPNAGFLVWVWMRNLLILAGITLTSMVFLATLGPILQTGVLGSWLAAFAYWAPINALIHGAYNMLALPLLAPMHVALTEFPLHFVALISAMKVLFSLHVLCFDDHGSRLWPFKHASVVWQNDLNEIQAQQYYFVNTWSFWRSQWDEAWLDYHVLRLPDEHYYDATDPSNTEILLKTLVNPVRWARLLLKGLEHGAYVIIDLLCSMLGLTLGGNLAALIKAIVYLPIAIVYFPLESLINIVDIIPKMIAQAFTLAVYWPVRCVTSILAKFFMLAIYHVPFFSSSNLLDIQDKSQEFESIEFKSFKIINSDGEALQAYQLSAKNKNEAPTQDKYFISICNRSDSCKNLIEYCTAILTTLLNETKNYHAIVYDARGASPHTSLAHSINDLIQDGICHVQHLLDKGVAPSNITINGHSLGGFVGFWVFKHFRDKGYKVRYYGDRTFYDLAKVVTGWIYGVLTGDYHDREVNTRWRNIAMSIALTIEWMCVRPVCYLLGARNIAETYGTLDSDAQAAMEYSNCKDDGIVHYKIASLNAGLKPFRAAEKKQYNDNAYQQVLQKIKRKNRARKTWSNRQYYKDFFCYGDQSLPYIHFRSHKLELEALYAYVDCLPEQTTVINMQSHLKNFLLEEQDVVGVSLPAQVDIPVYSFSKTESPR